MSFVGGLAKSTKSLIEGAADSRILKAIVPGTDAAAPLARAALVALAGTSAAGYGAYKVHKHLKKTSGLDNHTDGSQFNRSENEPAAYNAPGGMSPTGIESYNSTGKDLKYQGSNAKKKMQIATNICMGKIGMVKWADLEGNGQGQGASTLASQLKWESTTPGSLMSPGSDPESEQQYKDMQRAKKNKGVRK